MCDVKMVLIKKRKLLKVTINVTEDESIIVIQDRAKKTFYRVELFY